MNLLEINGLTAAYGKNRVLDKVTFSIQSGELCALLGLNGSGKTTLLNSICGFVRSAGDVRINGADCSKMNEKQRAGYISYLPQTFSDQEGRNVIDVVLMGFNPHLGLLEFPGAEHRLKAKEALKTVGLENKINRRFDTLSQGEKQLVILSRCLVQDSPLMLLDEPDSSLDYPNRHIVLTHIKNITRDKDYAGLMTLHDPNYALNYCDRILLLKNGTIRSEINIKESSAEMIEERLSEVYGDIRVIKEEKIFVVIKK